MGCPAVLAWSSRVIRLPPPGPAGADEDHHPLRPELGHGVGKARRLGVLPGHLGHFRLAHPAVRARLGSGGPGTGRADPEDRVPRVRAVEGLQEDVPGCLLVALSAGIGSAVGVLARVAGPLFGPASPSASVPCFGSGRSTSSGSGSAPDAGSLSCGASGAISYSHRRRRCRRPSRAHPCRGSAGRTRALPERRSPGRPRARPSRSPGCPVRPAAQQRTASRTA